MGIFPLELLFRAGFNRPGFLLSFVELLLMWRISWRSGGHGRGGGIPSLLPRCWSSAAGPVCLTSFIFLKPLAATSLHSRVKRNAPTDVPYNIYPCATTQFIPSFRDLWPKEARQCVYMSLSFYSLLLNFKYEINTSVTRKTEKVYISSKKAAWALS